MPRRLLHVIAALGLASAPVACGAERSAAASASSEPGRVRVTSGLALEGPRLAAALRALDEVMGHAVEITIDGALVERETSFHLDVAREVEALAAELAGRAGPGDDAFPSVLAAVDRIEVRYEPVAPERFLDTARRRVVLRIGVGAPWRVAPLLVAERDRLLDARFAGRTAGDAAADGALYTWWAERRARRGASGQ